MQQNLTETITSNQVEETLQVLTKEPEEVIAYFIIDNHPLTGTRIREECKLSKYISQTIFQRLVQFVFRDLLSMQKLGIHQNNLQNSNFSSMNKNQKKNDDDEFPMKCKMTFLNTFHLALVSLFFTVVTPQSNFSSSSSFIIHTSITFVLRSYKDSARLHFIFPTLRDRLLLISHTILYNISIKINNLEEEEEENKNYLDNNDNGEGRKINEKNIDIISEWLLYIPQIIKHTNGWMNAGVIWEQINSNDTLFPLIYDGNRSIRNFAGFISAALENYRCIIRGDDINLVSQWIHTIILFMQDTQLVMATTVCSQNINDIIPDLTLQGTTCIISEISTIIPLFRHPPVILDVSKRLDESAHLFPMFTLIRFDEYRRATLRCSNINNNNSINISRFGCFRTRITNRSISPIVSSVCDRICYTLTSKSSTSSILTTSGSFISSIYQTRLTGQENMQGMEISTILESPNESTTSPSKDSCETSIKNSNMNPTINMSISICNNVKIQNAILLLLHWRHRVQLRALELVVMERNTLIYNSNRSGNTDVEDNSINPYSKITEIHEADRRVLEVAVAFFTPIQVEKEHRERESIRDSFMF